MNYSYRKVLIDMRFKIMIAQILIILFIATGCSTTAEKKTNTDGISVNNKSLKEIQILIPGSKLPNTEDIINEINKKTTAALNTTVNIEFSAWEDLSKKLKTSLSSGQKLDIVTDSYSSFKQMVSEGKYAQLDESLTQYGQQILKVRPKEIWDSNKIDGKIMGIPIEYTFRQNYGQWYIRKDIREKLGFQAIKTNDDLIKFLYTVKDNEKDIIVSATNNNFMYLPGQNRIYIAGKGKIRTTPAMEYSYILYFNENDGKVHNMFDEQNQIIWNEYASARKLYADKITFECNLSFANEKLNFLRDGRLAAYYGVIDNNALNNLKIGLKQKILNAEIEVYTEPSSAESYVTNFRVKNVACIPESSSNKDRAVQFLNWANQKENYNLIVHGIEGIDWSADGPDKYKSLKDNDSIQTMITLVASPNNLMFNNKTPDAYLTEFKKYQNPKNLVTDILSGFEFDPYSIAKELQECIELHKTNYSYIINGSADPEQSWDLFKNAAYEVVKKIQIELQRQIDIYLKSK